VEFSFLFSALGFVISLFFFLEVVLFSSFCRTSIASCLGHVHQSLLARCRARSLICRLGRRVDLLLLPTPAVQPPPPPFSFPVFADAVLAPRVNVPCRPTSVVLPRLAHIDAAFSRRFPSGAHEQSPAIPPLSTHRSIPDRLFSSCVFSSVPPLTIRWCCPVDRLFVVRIWVQDPCRSRSNWRPERGKAWRFSVSVTPPPTS